METTAVLEKIKACDDQYLSLFCTKGREWGLFVYQDRLLPELPEHNFLRIPDHILAGRLRGLCDVARNTANATGRSFLRIELSQPLHFTNALSEHYGRYYLNDEAGLTNELSSNLSYLVVDSEEAVNKHFDFEVENAADQALARRKAERFSSVYLADNGLTCWLCACGDKIVGKGELFVCGDTAKIASIASSEDGSDAVSEQLISFLARQGKKMGAELIYTYSENDIAGFTKLDDTYSVQWQF